MSKLGLSSASDQHEIAISLHAIVDLISGDLVTFTESLFTHVEAGLDEIKDARLIISILKTLSRMVGYEDYPIRVVESPHKPTVLMRHPTAQIYECHMEMASSIMMLDRPQKVF